VLFIIPTSGKAFTDHANQVSIFYVAKRELFVGNAALGVPHFDEKAGRNGEGAVPYRSIFLINRTDLCVHR